MIIKLRVRGSGVAVWAGESTVPEAGEVASDGNKKTADRTHRQRCINSVADCGISSNNNNDNNN